MGCDAHVFVEFSYGDENSWRPFGGEFRIGRDYNLFNLMANVRTRRDERVAIVDPRGVPDDMGYSAKWSYWRYVSNRDFDGASPVPETVGVAMDYLHDNGFSDESDYIRVRMQKHSSRIQAERAIAGGAKCINHGDRVAFVENTDWHSATWFNLPEVERLGEETSDPVFLSLVVAMQAMVKIGNDVRMIVWFDN